MKKTATIIFILICFFACKEPFDFFFDEEENTQLVIDGFLTDSLKQHQIKLSYSSGFYDTDRIFAFELDPITDAIVSIVDDQNIGLSLTHTKRGIYLTPEFAADELRAYKLVVDLGGERYETDFQQMPDNQPAQASASWEPEIRDALNTRGDIIVKLKGVRIDVEVPRIQSTEPIYYQWVVDHYWIHEATQVGYEDFCILKDYDRPQVDILRGYNVSGGDLAGVTFEVDYVENTFKFIHNYAVAVSQLIVDKATYEYWRTVKDQIERTGSLFDPAPKNIVGNIKNAQTGEPGLGHFGVYRETGDIVFFNQNELPYGNQYFACYDPPDPSTPYLERFNVSGCYNCVIYPSTWGVNTTSLPDWWKRPARYRKGG